MDDIRYEQEKRRLEAILERANVHQQHRDTLAPVVDNLAWMRIKLDDAREAVKNSSVVIKYSNGGGQEGLRENPLFKGYESLWKSYMNGLSVFTSYLPKEIQDEVIQENNVLSIVRKMKEA